VAPTRTRARWELLAVLASALLHLLTTLWVRWQAVDQIVLGVGWVGYVAARARVPGVLAGWGLHRRGCARCARTALWVLAVGVGAIAAIGLARGTFVLDLNLLPLLAVYPLWGFIQQLLVLGLVLGNLERFGVGRPWLVAIAAVGFAAVHVPDWPLCGATLLLGAACSVLFLRCRNLWPLGVLHGWLGACFYRWVLARDPWAELLAALLPGSH
jgi:uncharacterized protein